jgi:hypothetical protein
MAIPFETNCFYFNNGRYRPIIDALMVWTPIPMPGSFGDWVHTTYGGNFFDGDGKKLHTQWQVQVQIFDDSDYAKFKDKYLRWAQLSAPPEIFTGSKLARLAGWSDMKYHRNKGYWTGQVTFEWR